MNGAILTGRSDVARLFCHGYGYFFYYLYRYGGSISLAPAKRSDGDTMRIARWLHFGEI